MEPFNLYDLVSQDQATLAINYRTKVRRLELMARDTLAYTVTGRGHFDLSSLLPHLPQLKEIYIKEIGDQAPFRIFGAPRQSYQYSPKLWSSLNEAGVQLTGWRWSNSMTPTDAQNLTNNDQFLFIPPGEKLWFQHLKHLEVARLQLQPSLDNVRGSPEPDPTKDVSALFTTALHQLDQLESLSLESCMHMSWDFLVDLPKSIKEIKIINTPWLSSEAVHAFMQSHGRGLEVIDLSHNQYLDLAFTVYLRDLCPNLRSLKMDTTYFSAFALQKDSEPLYDHLLQSEDVPTWPAALQSLELTNLRKWDLEAVQVFFGSLITAAPQLPHLRRIVIRAMLSIGWRDRASFRDKYIGTLDRIFKRRSPRPNPHLASLRAYRLYREALEKRSTLPSAPPPMIEAEIPVSTDGKALRRSSRAKVIYAESDSSNSSENEDGHHDVATANQGSDDQDFKGVPVQGMCEVVDVNIDNLRPAEVQFHEADFVDSEISGDEDWSERREAEGQARRERYAW